MTIYCLWASRYILASRLVLAVVLVVARARLYYFEGNNALSESIAMIYEACDPSIVIG